MKETDICNQNVLVELHEIFEPDRCRSVDQASVPTYASNHSQEKIKVSVDICKIHDQQKVVICEQGDDGVLVENTLVLQDNCPELLYKEIHGGGWQHAQRE